MRTTNSTIDGAFELEISTTVTPVSAEYLKHTNETGHDVIIDPGNDTKCSRHGHPSAGRRETDRETERQRERQREGQRGRETAVGRDREAKLPYLGKLDLQLLEPTRQPLCESVELSSALFHALRLRRCHLLAAEARHALVKTPLNLCWTTNTKRAH